MISVIRKAGVHDMSAISTCINKESFKSWVADETDRATHGPLPDSNVKTVTGTPTIIVDGLQYIATSDWGDASEFQAFVVQASSATFNPGPTSSNTPTASPIPTVSSTP